MIYVRHKPRPKEASKGDERVFLVLEESPSFYIVFSPGEGVGIRAKQFYEEVKGVK